MFIDNPNAAQPEHRDDEDAPNNQQAQPAIPAKSSSGNTDDDSDLAQNEKKRRHEAELDADKKLQASEAEKRRLAQVADQQAKDKADKALADIVRDNLDRQELEEKERAKAEKAESARLAKEKSEKLAKERADKLAQEKADNLIAQQVLNEQLKATNAKLKAKKKAKRDKERAEKREKEKQESRRLRAQHTFLYNEQEKEKKEMEAFEKRQQQKREERRKAAGYNQTFGIENPSISTKKRARPSPETSKIDLNILNLTPSPSPTPFDFSPSPSPNHLNNEDEKQSVEADKVRSKPDKSKSDKSDKTDDLDDIPQARNERTPQQHAQFLYDFDYGPPQNTEEFDAFTIPQRPKDPAKARLDSIRESMNQFTPHFVPLPSSKRSSRRSGSHRSSSRRSESPRDRASRAQSTSSRARSRSSQQSASNAASNQRGSPHDSDASSSDSDSMPEMSPMPIRSGAGGSGQPPRRGGGAGGAGGDGGGGGGGGRRPPHGGGVGGGPNPAGGAPVGVNDLANLFTTFEQHMSDLQKWSTKQIMKATMAARPPKKINPFKPTAKDIKIEYHGRKNGQNQNLDKFITDFASQSAFHQWNDETQKYVFLCYCLKEPANERIRKTVNVMNTSLRDMFSMFFRLYPYDLKIDDHKNRILKATYQRGRTMASHIQYWDEQVSNYKQIRRLCIEHQPYKESPDWLTQKEIYKALMRSIRFLPALETRLKEKAQIRGMTGVYAIFNQPAIDNLRADIIKYSIRMFADDDLVKNPQKHFRRSADQNPIKSAQKRNPSQMTQSSQSRKRKPRKNGNRGGQSKSRGAQRGRARGAAQRGRGRGRGRGASRGGSGTQSQWWRPKTGGTGRGSRGSSNRGNRRQFNPNRPFQKFCKYCKSDQHFYNQCKKDDRLIRNKWCQDQQRCFFCAGKGHSVEECRTKQRLTSKSSNDSK